MSNNPLLTTRFYNATYQQNSRVRKENEEIGCIYGSPMAINEKYTSFDSLSFMIEMNNEANRIEGIGLIRNRICFDRRFQILYDNGNYNRYIYKGSYRLDRLVIEEYNPKLVELFDHILFKGKSHMKRSVGISRITSKLYKKELCVDFYKMNRVLLDEGEGEGEGEGEEENEDEEPNIINVEKVIKKEISRIFKTYFK